MIIKELEKIVREEQEKGMLNSYIRNVLKEYLQVYILYFIYTSKEYSKKMIFTGGTCLRHFFDLARLSEDIDFDYLHEFEIDQLRKDIESFFIHKYQYREVQSALKQKGQQVLIKLPVLKKLGLSKEGESEFLHVKLDILKNPSRTYSLETTSKSIYGFNYAAKHYSLPDLMAGKIHAILTRSLLKGKENKATVKGRDYYDLLWFLKKGIKPSLKRLSEMLNQKITKERVEKELDDKVQLFTSKYKDDFLSDMTPLISNPDFIPLYIKNYEREYLRYKQQSFE
ncbi:MAG: nucleotidyl transferase AbiEii/AbiGii toxin family protein [Chlamydiae bacterium]|nr:nucleotidyl transferase AbiEii/AbiGii toxin family protein [Chlamydiota bacterium]MBI3277080.1 nucleotidyl transferase AbiEii/AbiGii toxin family protein [Chlamydiota bacterium]